LQGVYKQRCLLVILKAWTGSSESTFYFSSKGYNTTPFDSLPAIAFSPRVLGDASLRRSVPFYGSQGESKNGTLTLANKDGALDVFLQYSFGGRDITLLLGDMSWSYSDFAAYPFLQGTIESVKVSNDEVQIFLRDKIAKINKPVQTTLLAQGVKVNEPAPLAIGKVRNAPAISINPNESGGRYKWHTGQVFALDAVKVNGYPVAYTAYNSLGEFVLTVRPTVGGTVTVDGRGAVDGSGALVCTPAAALKYLVSREGLLTDADFDSASCAALDAAKPYTLGLYINARDNLLAVTDKLFTSVGGGYYFSRDGKVHAGYIQNPASLTASKTIYGWQFIKDNPVSIDKTEDVCWRVRLNYQHNFAVLNQVAGAVSATDEAWYKNEWSTAFSENASVKTIHLSANDPDAINTCIDSMTDAQTETNARFSILSGLHYEHTLNLKGSNLFDPYDVVYVDYPRLGLPGNIQILEVEDFYLANRCTVKGWR